ncbi:hypothetical protein EDL99_11230 [Ornithobacterium rhinotracheale]|uniref:Rha family transcriptional regulator n=1 Tax=Ornithobacterium rhinotracheale TaxID=28251 RepID=UPI00129CD780|nr:Rha family transcriptional regulator [Ornithobacterium rhinotracheale]MRJ09421.1 hypothetical protein [Ornithobacterium rhinotracheale]UOH77219.1 Rha family transcriptional regulator [Ornithobacterium rhinotracheale]UOH77343.1 Rha family transcriptional regulator [Ornithobacterium rhinotracheale]UOH77644.1 Rha family transcriptional regulator [Ornithobacterium rhinotracheale]
MNNLSIKGTMSSREIAQIAGRPHNDVLKSIRKMERSWRNVTGGNFSLSEYTDSTGRKLPEYQLTKTECLYIATKFNDEARARLVLRWEALEGEKLKNYIQMPKAINVFGMEALPYDWWLLQNGYSVSSGQRNARIRKHPEHFYKGTNGWYINKLYAEALLAIKQGKEKLKEIQALPQVLQVEMF